MTARRLFVTGTDTDVGKTVVSAALTLGLDAYYWKPIQAGTTPSTDTESVREWTGLPADRFLPEAYRLREPMSPHAAAEVEGVEIDRDRIATSSLPTDRPVVIEGAGGLLVPINASTYIVDLIEDLGAPVVLVARSGLGTLNHTLLSLAELRRRSIPVLGVVMNGDPHESNRRTIEGCGGVRVLGRIPRFNVVNKINLLNLFTHIDLK